MKKIIVLNQKMYMDYTDVVNYIKKLKDNIRRDIEVVVCPSSIFIPYFCGKYDFKLGSQDLHYEFVTGEVSGKQLKSLGICYSIIGNCERKELLHEDSKIINLKILEAINNNIIPIVCVGETKEERNRKKTAEVIIKQLREYFKDVEFGHDIIIAYEPVWAISTGNVPNNNDIKEVISLIKENIFRKYNINIKVLYGGSVNETNIIKLKEISDLDGFLIGKTSTDIDKTLQIFNILD